MVFGQYNKRYTGSHVGITRAKGPLEVPKCNSNDTYINETNLNNVNRAGSKGDVENSREEIIEISRRK